MSAFKFNDLPDEQLLRIRYVIKPVGPVKLGASTLWRRVKDGTFPMPVDSGNSKITCWAVGDIRAWLKENRTPRAAKPACEEREAKELLEIALNLVAAAESLARKIELIIREQRPNAKHCNEGTWEKGKSGNPLGRKKKVVHVDEVSP